MSPTPHSNDPRDNPGEFLVGKDGKPLIDRYGRPIRKRSTSQPPRHEPQRPRHESQSPRSSAPQASRQDDGPIRKTLRPRQPLPRETSFEPRRSSPERQFQDPGRRQQPQRPRNPREVQNLRQVQNAQRPRHTPPRREEPWEPRLELSPQRRVRPVQPAAQPAPRGWRPKLRRPRAGCIPTLLSILLVLVVAGTLFTDARLTRVDAFPDTPVPNTAGTNWLIVGSDSREGLSEKDAERLGTGGDIGTGRTDTIMLMHIPTAGKATLLSIPRDSYVEIPGYGMDKINAAFAFGGPKLLAETVENATHLRIDHYAEIGMGGLAGITDAVGGVQLCPSEPIDDPLAQLNVQAGCQKMDGPTALGYVRTRATAMGDLDRVQRQREFVGALMKRALSPAVLLNPFRLIPLVLRGSSMFIVGEGDHVWHLARMALALRGGTDTETVPVANFIDTDVGSVLVWDDAAAEQLFAGLR
ncbi:LCP family protein [Corynebacterium sp. P3-F1]|uniref:LCP family protein n=1 Tax=Corynebacterium sp. P3-F1 TaxID=3059080 RepID=UPI00265CA386|nr:LCP family protein [Corynebacterium sp. P3-F1]WKK60524.1 LCP family protein [Corynebacterium sp. P3-F1]